MGQLRLPMASRAAKRAAQKAVAIALSSGVIPRPSCCVGCGYRRPPTKWLNGKSPHRKMVCHHWSYAVEHHLDTISLCIPCHSRIHAGTQIEPRTGRMYTRFVPYARLRFLAVRAT